MTVHMNGPRRAAVIGTVVGCSVVVVLLLLTSVSGWAPFAHWTCQDEGKLVSQYMKIPAALVNSPYGGSARGIGIMPADFPGGPGYPNKSGGYSAAEMNGAAGAEMFSDNISLDSMSSVLVLGPGNNVRCGSSFLVRVSPGWFPAVDGVNWLGPGNLSDAGEPTTYNMSAYLYHPLTPSWNNSFTNPTQTPLDTCGGYSQTVPVTTLGPSIVIHFEVSGRNVASPFILPFVEEFVYTFPANFGTWQIDNLSAPGGPGGGWAFNYTGPCS